jgi:hypothetical protein
MKLPDQSFFKFCQLEQSEREKYMKSAFPDDSKKIDQVEKCIAALPLIDVNIEAGCLGHDEVCVNDLLNVKIKVKLSQLVKGQESGYVHSR